MFEKIIASNANLWPDRPAILMGDHSFSYIQMSQDIGRCVTWLTTLGLPSGGRALICIPHAYLHWILTFALERMGLATASASRAADVPDLTRRLEIDAIFSTEEVDPVGMRPIYNIGQAWIDHLAGLEAHGGRTTPARPADPIRYIVTSGTTGVPKVILLDRQTVARGIEILTLAPDLHQPGIRTATTVTMNSIGGWNTALWTWLEGGTFNVFTAGRGFAKAVETDGLDLVFGAPSHLQALLSDLPQTFQPVPDLVFGIFGGSISARLADQCRARITPNIVVTYGSTEAGISAIGRVDAMGDPEAAGIVCPWAEFEVRDEAGRSLPAGEVGEIRFRTDYACAAYAFEDGPSEMFQDGWFCPGDLGSVSAAGIVKILGRTNDLMNIGGSKFLAPLLDQVAMKLDGVLDAAAFTAPDADGLEVAFVAVVPAADTDPVRISEGLRAAMKREIRILLVDAIPRNDMGKIQRLELRGLARSLGA